MPNFTRISPTRIKFLASLWLGLLALATAAHADVTEVMREIDRSGQARVIITLKTGNGDTLPWSAAQSVAQQRGAITAAVTRLQGSLAPANIALIKRYRTLPFAGAVVNRTQLLALLDMPQVAGIALVHKHHKIASASATPFSLTLQDSVASIDVPPAWAAGYQGKGVTVVIVDGGVNINHPMLVGRNVGDACFADQFSGFNAECPSGQTPQIGSGAASNCILESDGVTNRCDHGSNVTGIAVGNDGTNFGVARLANYMPIDVFSSDTSSSDCSPDPAPCEVSDEMAEMDALDYVNENVTQYNIAAVNMSLGGNPQSGACDDDPIQPIIATLRAKGVAVAIAAGNDGLTGQVEDPACISSSIAVGATDDGSDVASFSNFATNVDLMAPGVDIASAAGSGSGLTSLYSGTSMATPHVAGAFALIRAALPNDSVTQIESALEATGIPVTLPGAGFSVPKVQVMQAISDLNGTDHTIFNQVVSSSGASAGLSYLRIFNNSAAAGIVSINFVDPASGVLLGTWTSGSIAANAAPQFQISTLESNAVPASGQTITSPTRTSYNLQIESSFPAEVQYVLWGNTAGVVANLTSCNQTVAINDGVLIDVYGSSASASYISHIRLTNTGSVASAAMLTFNDVNSGQRITSWTSPSIAAGASLDMTEPQIEAVSNALAAATKQGSNFYNVVLGSLTGYMQHVIENRPIGAFTDMSMKCQVPLSPALQAPGQTASSGGA